MGVSTTKKLHIAAKNFVHFRNKTHTKLIYLLNENLMQLSNTGKKVLKVNCLLSSFLLCVTRFFSAVVRFYLIKLL